MVMDGGFLDGCESDEGTLIEDHEHTFNAPWCELCGPPCRRSDDDVLCTGCREKIGRWTS